MSRLYPLVQGIAEISPFDSGFTVQQSVVPGWLPWISMLQNVEQKGA
jgi:hypothetical protein